MTNLPDEVAEIRPMMTDPEIDHLCSIAAKVLRELEIVELGAFAGGSTNRLGRAVGSAGAHITSIDSWMLGAAQEAIQAFMQTVDLRYVTPLRATSAKAAQMWLKPIGLLFIDASHEFFATLEDYTLWAKHVPVGGYVAFHDVWDEALGSEQAPWMIGPTKVVRDVVEPSGEFDEIVVVDTLWTGRRQRD